MNLRYVWKLKEMSKRLKIAADIVVEQTSNIPHLK